MYSSHSGAGRAELGQNFLHDRRVANQITSLVGQWPRSPIVELGPGDGALTSGLIGLGAPVTAVELDPRMAEHLRKRHGRRLHVVNADLLRYMFSEPCYVVANVPFHLTTPLLRRLLAAPYWKRAALLVQWEVARKRAAVGGTTLMTARWWPWFEFSLEGRVTARSFRPVPSVDAGILTVERREHPRVAWSERRAYQQLVEQVFSGRGSGIGQIACRQVGRGTARAWMKAQRVNPNKLPKDLTAPQWADLFARAAG